MRPSPDADFRRLRCRWKLDQPGPGLGRGAFPPFFQAVRAPIDATLNGVEGVLLARRR
jgi:hypothetical protein